MIPHSLIIENFMSHENSRLDFNQFEAALLIGSKNGDTDISNGVGKTAIFDSIVWVLFDKSRFKTKDRVIKRGKSFCRVEFIFSVENNRYKIIRKFNSKGVTDISIFLQQGSEWKDLTCDTSRVTNKKIIEIVKLNYETFINSVYFKQHDLLRFANARAADRKEILKDLLQIGVWDRYQDRAKSIVRDLKSKKESIDERIISLGNVEDENNILVSKLSNIESLIIETDTDIKNIEKELRKARENLGIVKASLDITKTLEIEKKIKNLEKKGASLLLKKESIKKEAQSVKDNIQQMKENNKTLNEIIKKSAENLIIIEHKGTKKAEKILGKTGEYIEPVDKNLIKKLEKFIILHNQKISQTEMLVPGNVCPTCLRKIENIEDVIKNRNETITKIKENKEKAEVKLKGLKNKLKEFNKIKNKADDSFIDIEKSEFVLSKNEETIEELQNKLKDLHDNFVSVSKKYKEIISEIKILSESVNEDPKNKLIEAEKKVEDFQNKIEILRQKRIDLGSEAGNIQGKIENIQIKKSELSVLIDQKEKVNENLDIHRRLVKAFGKGGVQAIIMENVTEDLQTYANNVMRQIGNEPMTVEFVTQRQTSNKSWSETFDIKVYTDDGQVDIDDLSGGEQVRISIALRIALSRILMRRVGSNIKFLLLDEVDQALDKKGLQALSEMIKILSKEFKILVITHNDNMKDNFDNVITIFKDRTGSVLVQ